MFLLIIAIHLSWEVSQLEEETRSISEEIALLRMDLERSLPDVSARREKGHDDPPDRSS